MVWVYVFWVCLVEHVYHFWMFLEEGNIIIFGYVEVLSVQCLLRQCRQMASRKRFAGKYPQAKTVDLGKKVKTVVGSLKIAEKAVGRSQSKAMQSAWLGGAGGLVFLVSWGQVFELVKKC